MEIDRDGGMERVYKARQKSLAGRGLKKFWLRKHGQSGFCGAVFLRGEKSAESAIRNIVTVMTLVRPASFYFMMMES